MYSRYQDSSDRPIRLPENYNGCAFSASRRSEERTRSDAPRRVEICKPAPNPAPREEVVEEKTPDEISEHEPSTETALTPLSGMLGRTGSIFPFSHGIGFDELLLLGLIVLLSHSEASSEIVLWLVLLLFCG